MEDSTALKLRINDLENQIKILSLHTPSANTSFAQNDRIKLNVGGHIFETTVQTLRRYPDSMLGAMFSGKFFVETDKDGTHFIDRDGTVFRYILNFLRDGIVPRHLSKSDLEYLLNEAEYYSLNEFIKAIQTAPLNSSSSIPKVEHIPDFVYEFGVPKQRNRAFHYDTMRGYTFTVKKPVLIEYAQLLVSGDQPFSCEANLVATKTIEGSNDVEIGTKTENIASDEPKWVTSHFSPGVIIMPEEEYCILWSFSPKSGYIYYAENGSNPQLGRDTGPFTVFGRKAPSKWVIESNYYNIRMRVSAKEVSRK